jgi:hypothetical protein
VQRQLRLQHLHGLLLQASEETENAAKKGEQILKLKFFTNFFVYTRISNLLLNVGLSESSNYSWSQTQRSEFS